ncbi:MAG TPA: transporter [Candidatus Cybelea sp.]|nr:transporter [Candidatus Cybelea sp.]
MRSLFPALIFALATTSVAVAGPPFLTDDPVPTDYQHYEIYTYVDVEKNAGVATTTTGPSLEFNWGALRNVQVSATLPYAFLSTPPSPSAFAPDTLPGATVSGFGDTELAVKYRFLQETVGRPQMSFYPAIEIPTGNSATGIGNGRSWYRFPVWIQKSWGRWTSYGGGGYAINTASDQKNYSFGGWLLQRDFSENVSVGAEIYSQGAQFAGDKATTLYNAGSYISLTKTFGILFSLGHSFSGDDESVAYFALGFIGPFGKSAALLDAAAPRPGMASAVGR